MSLVSVIIPCFNSEEYIDGAITSVLRQTYKEIETIVIDDGSDDSSVNIISKFRDRIKFFSQENKGVSSARNLALKYARGEFIKFLDADDILVSDAIERQVNESTQLDKTKKLIVYGYLAKLFDNKKSIFPKSDTLTEDDDQLAYLIADNHIVTSCPLHRRDYLLEVNGFDETLEQGEEPDLHIRLVLNGVKFIYRPTFVYYYRQHRSPDRISVKKWYPRDPSFGFRILNKYESMILNTNGALSDKVRQALSDRHSSFGRNLIKYGHERLAIRHFDKARQLSPNQQVRINKSNALGRIYFLASGLIGYRFTETLLTKCLHSIKFLLKWGWSVKRG